MFVHPLSLSHQLRFISQM